MKCRVDLNEPKIMQKVTNQRVLLFSTAMWWQLTRPYTPRDTGRLEETAKIEPGRIIYNPVSPETGEHYAQKVYYGEDINFHTTHNPYATHHWDRAAEQAGKKSDLYREINDYIHN